jgi:hypothetical protein
MIAQLFAVVLVWMTTLAPGVDHAALAWAVASSAASTEEAALIVAVAYRESGLDNAAVGDHGRSVCAMQILHGGRELLDDPQACVRRGVLMLRASKRVSAESPVAFYARGPRWQSDEAQRISRDRVALARRLLATVTP